MQIQPYLFFDGVCEDALEFYRTALGAEVMEILRNNESPDPAMCVPGTENKIMHCSFRIGDTTIYASDGRSHGQPNFHGFSLCITVPTVEETERRFSALSECGQIHRPLAKTFYSPLFGMVTDRFGVSWMVLAAA